MTKDNESVEVESISKFNKITLTIVAAVLIFVGPTYVPAVLSDTLKMDYVISVVIGAVLFILGLAVLIYLIRRRVVT
jgi:hypothetical protein